MIPAPLHRSARRPPVWHGPRALCRLGRVFLALVVNARSGGVTDAEDVISELGRHCSRVETFSIEELTSAGGIPGRAAGAQRLVVAGGDGSLGVAAHAAQQAGMPLAVVPTGTANDFARALRLPARLERACALAADPDARTRHHELGRGGDRLFVNAAAAGLSVAASRHAGAHKARLGRLAYIVGAVRAGLSAPTLHCRVRCDDQQRFAGQVWQVVIAATGAFGAGSAIGDTSHQDERLDVVVVPGGPRAALIRYAYGMRRRRLITQQGVGHHRCRTVEVMLPPGTEFNIDGDLHACGQARFVLVPGGFEVVVP